jgi:agmatinase
MKHLTSEHNFLGIVQPELYSFDNSKIVIQSAPYEYTSSYLSGSAKGPESVINASHYVEFYDEETDHEAYSKYGICTLEAYDFDGKTDKAAVDLLYEKTKTLIEQNKFVVSLGAEHTVTSGFVRAFAEQYKGLKVLQIDAHSDLRWEYQGNPYSHASVMARVFEMGVGMCQVGIRAQCIEEAQLRKNNPNQIKTWYAHQIHKNQNWIEEVVSDLKDCPVYITIDADGFDPSVMPAVGTAEPNGLTWHQGTSLLKEVAQKCNVVGFDIVELAPKENEILTEFNCAKLLYKIISYLSHYNKI